MPPNAEKRYTLNVMGGMYTAEKKGGLWTCTRSILMHCIQCTQNNIEPVTKPEKKNLALTNMAH